MHITKPTKKEVSDNERYSTLLNRYGLRRIKGW